MKSIKFKNIEDIKDFAVKLKGNHKKNKHICKDFNFFRPYIEDEKNKKNREVYTIVFPVILIFFMITVFTWNYISIRNTKQDIRNMSDIINSPQSKLKLQQAEKLNKKHSILSKYDKQVEIIVLAIDKKSIIGKEFLSRISAAIPQSISFKTISIDDEGLQIQGTSAQRVNIAELQYNLKKIDRIKTVQVSTINESTEDGNNANTNYTFTLKCMLKDVGKNEN